MRYINPYEMAKFIQVNKLDITTFKKFKKRLSAELELNDNEIIINNISFQNNEIYEILDSIDKDKSLLNIYKSLYENQKLNDFLNGQLNITDIKNIISNIKTINILPEYFTKIRSDIAYAIRNLSIDSWNDNEDLDLAIDLINYALKFKVNSKTKDKFLSDKDDLKNIREEQQLMKFLDKIDNILNDTSILFSNRIEKIINILKQKNSGIENDTVALMVYTLIDKYIEKNETIILLYFSDLKKIFIYLKRISLDIKLKNILHENIQIIELREKGIQKNKENKYATYGMFIGGGIIGLFGGFIGLIIGAIIGSILGKAGAK